MTMARVSVMVSMPSLSGIMGPKEWTRPFGSEFSISLLNMIFGVERGVLRAGEDFWKPDYVERLRLGYVRGNDDSERVLTGHC